MAETEKILIVHDTYYPEVNEDFRAWLTEFYNNITSAANRIPGMSKEFVLSSELVEYPEDTPEINAKEYDFYIILIHDEVSRTQNLKFQFDQLLDYLKKLPVPVQKHKTALIFTAEVPLNHEILQIHIEKTIKFFSQSGFNMYNQARLISSRSREYWNKMFDILDLISHRVDVKSKIRPANKRPTIVYLGKTSPDLEGRRELLMHELTKRGIEVLPEARNISWKDFDDESLLDVLEYSDMIIQLVGGKSGVINKELEIPEVEKEYDLISKFIAGKTKRVVGKEKKQSWVIWLPAGVAVADTTQEKFIQKIKRQLGYSNGETEMISGTYEQLKNVILDALKIRVTHSIVDVNSSLRNYIYLVHEKSVYQEALDLSFQLKTHPLHITLTHDLYLKEGFIRNHIDTLSSCDAVLLYYGLDNINWYESTIKEIIKISQSQRERPFNFQAVIFKEGLEDKLQVYEEFLYLSRAEINSQEFFNDYLKKMIG